MFYVAEETESNNVVDFDLLLFSRDKIDGQAEVKMRAKTTQGCGALMVVKMLVLDHAKSSRTVKGSNLFLSLKRYYVCKIVALLCYRTCHFEWQFNRS